MQARFARSEEDAGIDLDRDAERAFGDAHLALLDQWRQRCGDLLGLVAQQLAVFLPLRIGLQIHDLRLFDRNRHRQRRRRIDLHHRTDAAARNVAESGRDRIHQHAVFAFIERGNRIHHDEEGKQQRNEISIRDEPALEVLVLIFLAPFH
jgi:hypothetical protein